MSNVLITGANRGIGLELVKLYAERGDRVLACCRNQQTATALQDLALSGDVVIHEVAVGDADSVAALATRLTGTPIDLLINNAGTSGPPRDQQTFSTMDFDGWAETLNINTMAPVRVMQALLPNLRAAAVPQIANISSQLGALDYDAPFAYAYCSSKAALNKFMKLAAIELKKEGINSCVIHPGWVQTDMGGSGADITPLESAQCIARIIDGLNADNTGTFWNYTGEVHAW